MKTKSVIAGSFPLQCLLGEHYNNSDVDIFCKGYTSDECREIFSNTCKLGTICDIDTYIYDTNDHGKISAYSMNGIVRNKKYKISDKLYFNVVQINRDQFEFVTNTFDFTFCQTIFEGVRMFFHPITMIKIGYCLCSSLPHIKKYSHYHHKSKLKKECDPSDALAYLRIEYTNREEKYKSRGFIIYNSVQLVMIRDILSNIQITTKDESNNITNNIPTINCVVPNENIQDDESKSDLDD